MPEEKKKNSIVGLIVILVIFALFITLGIMFGGKSENKSNLAACGDFPKVEAGGGPTSYYHVCRNADSGDCYYKKTYFKQLPGCDPQFSDENPYGREECFKNVAAIYDFNGKLIQDEQDGYRSTDNCANTSNQYFDSKVITETNGKSVNWCSEINQIDATGRKTPKTENELWISSEYFSGMKHGPTIRHICRGSKELFYLQMEWNDSAAVHVGKLIAINSLNSYPISSSDKDPDFKLLQNENSTQIRFSIDGTEGVFNETDASFKK